MKNGIARSPLFYVGDKYKLIREIRTHFPNHINRLIEPFVGGGSVMMNVNADSYLLNDIDTFVIGLHRTLSAYVGRENELFDELYGIIDQYALSLSYRNDVVPQELKRAFPKTYYARHNKEAYLNMKEDFIAGGQRDMTRLYLLLIYGFNHMLRFNRRGIFNLPVGNVDFNRNVHEALSDYFELLAQKQIQWHNEDFRVFLGNIQYEADDLVYLDPPYLITFSEYNKLWNDDTERDLLALLDDLDNRNVRFAISNVTQYRGRTNNIFLEWAREYNCYPI